jgi:dTDP-4-dehydrorhamnose reductase
MKIAITGHTGRLGGELWREWELEPLMCDITVPQSVYQSIQNVKPDVVIHCAAFTDVDYCEGEDARKMVMDINVNGLKNLRMAFDGKIVHVSTDYIFDGLKGPYHEKSIANPISVYGESKLASEKVLLGESRLDFPDDVVVRTTILYGNKEKDDFVSKILNHCSFYRDMPIKVTKLVSGNPTYIPHLAEALINIAERDTRYSAVINVAGREIYTRYEFALMIAKVFNCDPDMIKPTNKIPGVASRPKKAGLKIDYAERMGIPIYSVYEGLEDLYCSMDYV